MARATSTSARANSLASTGCSRRSSRSAARRRPRPTRAASARRWRSELKSCSPPPARSTGLRVAAVCGSSGGEVGRQRVGEARQLEPGRVGDVAGDRAVAAAVADDGDPVAAQRVRAHERLDQVDHLVRRLHDVRAGGLAGGGDHGDVAHQRAGVRAGGAGARLATRRRSAARPACPAARGRVDEGAAVAEVLGVDGDQPRSPGARRSAATSSARSTSAWFPTDAKRENPRPASRARMPSSSARLPLWEIRPIEPGGNSFEPSPSSERRVEHAQAVGAEQHRAGGAHALDQRRARARCASAPSSPSPAVMPIERPRAGGERVVDRLLERGRRAPRRRPARARPAARVSER